ncbi:MAG: MMPL family transporter, partial [Spirochaetales bacterium]|nr:MMPL family transporter [Spirochaetales bacterium]
MYLPAILSLVRKPKQRQIKSYENGLMAKLVKKLSVFIPSNWKRLIVVFLILVLAFFLVKDRISVDANYMSYFPKSDPFGAESRRLAEEMGGTTPFEIKIKSDEKIQDFFLESENLQKVYDFEMALLDSPDTLQIISFPQYISFANQTVSGEAGIPTNKGLMNMHSRLVIAMQKQTGISLSTIINEDATEISLIVQNWDSLERDLQTVSSSKRMYALIMDSIELLPEGTSISIGGYPVVAMKFSNALLADQNKSTILSILAVFVLCMISFRSVTKGLLVLVPVLSGIMINYVFMFIAGIPFDMITVSFTSIAIGCGVDDAIHFNLRLKSNIKTLMGCKYKDIISRTIIETGRPIILTTVSIVAGMMMLGFASYTPIRYFGLLMSISLMGCMISTLIFLPPFIILFDELGKKIGLKKGDV